MVYWYVTLGYFSIHLCGIFIAYHQGHRQLKKRLKTKVVITHTNNEHNHDTIDNDYTNHHAIDEEEQSLFSATSSFMNQGATRYTFGDYKSDLDHDDNEREEKYDAKQLLESELAEEKLENTNSNNIDSVLFNKFSMSEKDKFEATQSQISWPLFVCILYILCMSCTVGIVYNWLFHLIADSNIEHINLNITSSSKYTHFASDLDAESLFILQSIVYLCIAVYVLYRVWLCFIVYKYIGSTYRVLLNLLIDYEVIYCFYITCKVNKYKHRSIITPLSHIHVFMSSVLSFWFILFLLIYLVLNAKQLNFENHAHNDYNLYLYITSIVCNYLSMTTALTMDDTNRLTHGLSLQYTRSHKSSSQRSSVSMSPSYIFRILFRHIDVLFRLLIFYCCVMSMGVIAFYCILFLEFAYCILNAWYWADFHYFLDVYQCLIVTALTLAHEADAVHNNHEQLRYSATVQICLQRMLSHFILIIFITCWLFIDFECKTCPLSSTRLDNITLAVYILLWIFFILYAIFWTFPVSVLNGNVSLKMLKISAGDIESLKDAVFYGVKIPSLKRSNFKIHPLQLYLLLTKQYDMEFIDILCNHKHTKHNVKASNKDQWHDNMLHNICCNETAPLHLINTLYLKYKVSWNEYNLHNLTPIHYYLQYNRHIEKEMIDLCINNNFTTLYTTYCGDNLLHKLCKNPTVNRRIMSYVLSKQEFIRLCSDKNKMGQTPFHCYLSLNYKLSQTVMSRFMQIYRSTDLYTSPSATSASPISSYIDSWGNTFLHSLCMNPKLNVEVLHYFTSSCCPLNAVLTKNYLNLKPIQYIESNHCYPAKCLQRMEYLMQIAKHRKEEEKEDEKEAQDSDKEDNPAEKKREKQLRLLKQMWFFDGRMAKHIGAEELFFDFLECIDCKFNRFGQITWFQIRGMLTFKSKLSEQCLVHLLTNDLGNWRYSNMSLKKLQKAEFKYVHLEYTAFHPCVNLHGWTKRRQIYFTPPNDVQFVLLSYRITQKYLDASIVPFRCYTSINYVASTQTVKFRITFQNNLNSLSNQPRYIAKLRIPFIDDKKNSIANIAASNGIYAFAKNDEANRNTIIWSIDNVSQFEPMIFEFDMQRIHSQQVLNEWLSPKVGIQPVIRVEFRFLSQFSFSKLDIQQYSVHDKDDKLKMLRLLKRTQSMNGSCCVQLT